MKACFHRSGNAPDLIASLKIIDNGTESALLHSFMMLIGIWSGPGDFPLVNFFKHNSTSHDVIVKLGRLSFTKCITLGVGSSSEDLGWNVDLKYSEK